MLVDTPALSLESAESPVEEAAQQRARDMLLRNKGRIDRAKDPITPGNCIIIFCKAILFADDFYLFFL